MILKKKQSYFEEELSKNRNKVEELWKTLKSLGLSSDKARQSKISLKKDAAIQFEALENANNFKHSTLNQPEDSKKNYQGHPTNLLVKKPKTTPRLHATYPVTLNFQMYLKMLKRFYLASIPVNLLKWIKYQQNV